MKKSEKSIDMSLKDIAEALNKSNYKGFMLYMNKDTLDTAFSINGESTDILFLLDKAYKKNEDFFAMIAASVFAHEAYKNEDFFAMIAASVFAYAVADEKTFAAIEKVYKVAKEIKNN